MKNVIIFIILIATSTLAIAGEKDLYDFQWLDPDKSVYVLQNKIYPKNKSFYIDLGYIDGLSSEFQISSGMVLKAGYFFHEEWGIELAAANYTHTSNAAYESIKVINGTEPFIRRITKNTSLFVIWSPFYGKINTFNKIFYFDWSFGLGIGQMQAESNLSSVTNPGLPSSFDSESYNPIEFKTGVKFHINKKIHFGVEYLGHSIQAGTAKHPGSKEWTTLNDLVFSMGVSF